MIAKHRESSRWTAHVALAGLLVACAQSNDTTFKPTGSGSGSGGDVTGGGGAGGASGSTTTGGPAGTLMINTAGAGGSGMTMGPCKNLSCQQTTCSEGACKEMPCAAGQSTQLTGTVLDPAGKVPL